MITHAVILTHVNYSKMPLVLLDHAAISKLVNPNLQELYVVTLSMNVICPSIVLDQVNFVLTTSLKLMELLVKLDKHFVMKVPVEHILINASCFGGHQEKNQIINAMSKTEKERGMAIVATIE